MSDKIKVGITHGDYNGIGYELILKILDDGRLAELCTPVIYGSAKIAANYRKQLGLQGQQLQQVKMKNGAWIIRNLLTLQMKKVSRLSLPCTA